MKEECYMQKYVNVISYIEATGKYKSKRFKKKIF